MDKISVILPVYNVEAYVERVIQALLNQTYSALEIFFIDDGSVDGSAEIIKKYEKIDSRVNYVFQENQGPSQARNKGIELSTCDFIVFVDPDDSIPQDSIEHLKSKMDELGADVVAGRFVKVFDDMDPSFLQKKYDISRTFSVENIAMTMAEAPDVLVNISTSAWAKIFRKSTLATARFPLGMWYEDLHFFACNAPFLGKFAYTSKVIYNYHIRPNSVMTSYGEKIFMLLDVFDDIIETYKKNNIYEQYIDELRFLMIQHMLIGMFFRIYKEKSLKNYTNMKRVVTYAKLHTPKYWKTKYLKSEPLYIRCFVWFTKTFF